MEYKYRSLTLLWAFNFFLWCHYAHKNINQHQESTYDFLMSLLVSLIRMPQSQNLQECKVFFFFFLSYITFWNCSVHSTKCLWESSNLASVEIIISYFLQNSISWYGWITVGLSIHSLEDIYIIFSLGLFQIKLLKTFLDRLLCEPKFPFSGQQPGAMSVYSEVIPLDQPSHTLMSTQTTQRDG